MALPKLMSGTGYTEYVSVTRHHCRQFFVSQLIRNLDIEHVAFFVAPTAIGEIETVPCECDRHGNEGACEDQLKAQEDLRQRVLCSKLHGTAEYAGNLEP